MWWQIYLTRQLNKNGYSIPEWENTKIKQVLKFLLQSQLLVGETEQETGVNDQYIEDI